MTDRQKLKDLADFILSEYPGLPLDDGVEIDDECRLYTDGKDYFSFRMDDNEVSLGFCLGFSMSKTDNISDFYLDNFISEFKERLGKSDFKDSMEDDKKEKIKKLEKELKKLKA